MERSAYDEMIASGMAKSFADPAVRRRLSSYYAGTERLEAGTIYSTGYRDRMRREMMLIVQQRLRDRCSDVVTMSRDGVETVTLPKQCILNLPPATIAREKSFQSNQIGFWQVPALPFRCIICPR